MIPQGLPACMCSDALGFVCSLHRDDPPSNLKQVGSKLEECPWNPDELPERLQGYGHRGADQDGYDGSEWVTPQQDLEGQMIEAAKVLLDAEEI